VGQGFGWGRWCAKRFKKELVLKGGGVCT